VGRHCPSTSGGKRTITSSLSVRTLNQVDHTGMSHPWRNTIVGRSFWKYFKFSLNIFYLFADYFRGYAHVIISVNGWEDCLSNEMSCHSSILKPLQSTLCFTTRLPISVSASSLPKTMTRVLKVLDEIETQPLVTVSC
jgi:hypothetical protein